MRAVIQRVGHAVVTVQGLQVSAIGKGLLVLLGIGEADGQEDVEWLSAKLVNLRIFSDNTGKMNLPVKDAGGDILVVSQFTLHADTKKGNRPSFIRAARPEKAELLYKNFVDATTVQLGKPVREGIFGADMKINLSNEGPVTIIIDTKNKE